MTDELETTLDLCKWLRDQYDKRGEIGHFHAADAIAALREQVAWEKTINEGLRSIQPAWAEEKWITAAALTQIWNKLGAKNQTEAILALEKSEAENAAKEEENAELRREILALRRQA